MSRLLKEYEKHINSINNQEFRQHVVTLIKQCPDYIADCPSSSTGKYHPADEICTEGMMIHVNRCAVLAPEIGRMNQHNPEEVDVLVAGALLHDIYKNGIPDEKGAYGKYTHKDHELYIYNHIKKYIYSLQELKDLVYDMLWDLCAVCAKHSGQWVPESVNQQMKKDSFVMNPEREKLCDSMHIVDYVVSRRGFWNAMQNKDTGAKMGIDMAHKKTSQPKKAQSLI